MMEEMTPKMLEETRQQYIKTAAGALENLEDFLRHLKKGLSAEENRGTQYISMLSIIELNNIIASNVIREKIEAHIAAIEKSFYHPPEH